MVLPLRVDLLWERGHAVAVPDGWLAGSVDKEESFLEEAHSRDLSCRLKPR